MIKREQLHELAKTLEGIPVWGCLPGSTSDKAGIKYGDIILSVNGVKTPDAEAYAEAKELRPDGMSLEIFRDGNTHTIEVLFDGNQDLSEEKLQELAQQLGSARIFPEEEDLFASTQKKQLN